MTFGLKNAAQSFQRFIDQDLLGLDCSYAYLDDILIASENEDPLKLDVEKVFQRFQDYGLKINIGKWVFNQETLQFLGFQIASSGVSPLPDKVKVSIEYPLPKTVDELRRFLAMLNFYHMFLKNAAGVQTCLHDSLKGKSKKDKSMITWSVEAKTAFQACKDLFCRWPEAFPMSDQLADTVVRTLYDDWIARFGVLELITTDRGTNFESNLFHALTKFLGSCKTRTTAFHPAANGIVERMHRQLKASIKCHASMH
ncbi:Transposon Ty3-G Gag-Pol polyprotein [Araneus ventricosus]|uniref:Transposon Ty3-G Gag-Pol polyprotein n=1 Tax=Araneus ventricosus TaxID=182803 RepID=A0A4Y2N2J5_ARAVE|nr:Transposon Ty3-G Gag-Pol polyprotein [Araneus ventricosus]